MLETTIIIISTYAFICVLMAVFCVYRYYLGNRLTKAANRLNAQMTNIKRNFPELDRDSSEIVAKGLGNIGISGILDQLGIDSKIIQNPLVKGLIDKYAPKILEQLSKQKDGNNALPNQSFM